MGPDLLASTVRAGPAPARWPPPAFRVACWAEGGGLACAPRSLAAQCPRPPPPELPLLCPPFPIPDPVRLSASVAASPFPPLSLSLSLLSRSLSPAPSPPSVYPLPYLSPPLLSHPAPLVAEGLVVRHTPAVG